jgi:transcription antitermination protein NusB
MPARRRSRQRALQILFQWDARKLPLEDCVFDFYGSLFTGEDDQDVEAEDLAKDPFMETLAKGSSLHVVELDQLISSRAEHWRLERMPGVDRNILRMAVYEMKYEGTPAAVVIDEALELARRYSEEEAVPFINGVLDAVRRVISAEDATGKS